MSDLVSFNARFAFAGRMGFWITNVRVPIGADEPEIEEKALAMWRLRMPEGTPEPEFCYARRGGAVLTFDDKQS